MSNNKKTLTGIWQGQFRINLIMRHKDSELLIKDFGQMKGVELRQSGIDITGIGHLSPSYMSFENYGTDSGFEQEAHPTEPIKVTGTHVGNKVNLDVRSENSTTKLSGTVSNDGNEISGRVDISVAEYFKEALRRELSSRSPSDIFKLAGTLTMIESIMISHPETFNVQGDFVLTRTNDPSPNPGETVDKDEPVTTAVSKPAAKQLTPVR